MRARVADEAPTRGAASDAARRLRPHRSARRPADARAVSSWHFLPRGPRNFPRRCARTPPGGSREHPLKATRHRRPARTAYGPGLREAPSSLVFATGVRRDVARSSTVAAGLVMFAAAGDPLPPGRKGAAESRYSPLDEEIAAVVADLETDRRGDG